jgi:hypothetical protein
MRLPFAILLTALALAGADARLKVLVLTGETDLPYHDWRQSAPFLRSFLENSGRFDVRVLEEVRGATAPSFSGYDALILHYNGPRWTAATESALEEYLRSGKGMLSFHGTSYGRFFGMEFQKRWVRSPSGDAGWIAYPQILGASWKPENIGHGARHAFQVKWIDREHPVSRGMEAAFLANDELYHKLDLLPGTKVLASAYSDPATNGTGKEEPMIWTSSLGKGRTIHITLGHDLSAMYQPGFVTAFARGVEWAATGEVTLPPHISAAPLRTPDAVRVLVATGGHAYPAAFYTLFDGHGDIVWRHATTQPQAFQPKLTEQTDVVVLHDMYEKIGEAEQASLRAFIEAGKGLVSIHHSIVDYTSWPWFYQEVIGGKYFTAATSDRPASSFKEGVDLLATPVKAMASHPVIRGIGPIPAQHDEVYRGMWHSPKIQVLMETAHPENDRPVVYIGPHPKARAIYIQLGHGESVMRHPGYRRLVRNAILWSAGRLEK